uniref:winged helix-turn-helix domain-containing protein n=1 Tax=Streptomyces spectabilis TaxID=68270 RepID=UPI0027E4E087
MARGRAEHGWEDQRWTLARIRSLIVFAFGLDVSPAAVARLMHRHGWSWQSPAAGPGARRARRSAVEEGRVAAGGMTAGGAGHLPRVRGRGGVRDGPASGLHLGP